MSPCRASLRYACGRRSRSRARRPKPAAFVVRMADAAQATLWPFPGVVRAAPALLQMVAPKPIVQVHPTTHAVIRVWQAGSTAARRLGIDLSAILAFVALNLLQQLLLNASFYFYAGGLSY